ncbi:hypothetical protein [Dyadobacter alkalitolerans]|uniref:hypothetical protein n=1 Tax=Dyadobacter alkalitolerans TaxID=492736 RepID=UPI00040EBC67|nr:hypothetical protein [Dyadobacter alkalitolerans]
MSEKKFGIFIDDNPNESQIENIKSNLLPKRIDFNYEILNPTTFSIDGEGNVDIDEIFDTLFTDRYLKRTVDVIVCDYHLGLSNLNGFQMIRNIKIRSGGRAIPTILYSANMDEVIGDIVGGIGEFGPQKKLNSVIKNVKVLIEMNLDGLSKKENLEEGLLRFFTNNVFILENELEKQLERYKSWTFRSTYPPLANKTIEEVLEQIRIKSNTGIGFQKALLESAIAQLIEMNSEFNIAE